MKNLKDYFITEKLKLNKNINDTDDILVYQADTGGHDHELATLFIKNTDEDIEDFVMYWWREELPGKRPQSDRISGPYDDKIRKEYKEYFDEVKNYVDEIKDESITLADYITNIYDNLNKDSWVFADNVMER